MVRMRAQPVGYGARTVTARGTGPRNERISKPDLGLRLAAPR